MKIARKTAIFAGAAAALLMSSTANALTVGFDLGSDGTYEETVNDGDGDDLSGTAGVVTASKTLGGFGVNVAIGNNNIPVLTLSDLSFAANLTANDVSTITISVWDTVNASYPSLFTGDYSGTLTNASTEVVFTAGDGSATSGVIGASPFAGTETLSNTLGSPFLAQIDFVITAGLGMSQAQVDAQLKPVPLPAAAWLFGSAIVGTFLVGSRRRKEKQSIAA